MSTDHLDWRVSSAFLQYAEWGFYRLAGHRRMGREAGFPHLQVSLSSDGGVWNTAILCTTSWLSLRLDYPRRPNCRLCLSGLVCMVSAALHPFSAVLSAGTSVSTGLHLWPLSLPITLTCPPVDVSMHGSLRHICVLKRESFVEWKLSNLLQFQRERPVGPFTPPALWGRLNTLRVKIFSKIRPKKHNRSTRLTLSAVPLDRLHCFQFHALYNELSQEAIFGSVPDTCSYIFYGLTPGSQ